MNCAYYFKPARLFALALGLGLALSLAPMNRPLYAQALESSQANEAYARFFDDLLARQLSESNAGLPAPMQAGPIVPGAAVSVVQDGELVFTRGYGYADKESRKPVDPQSTQFFIGSAGKLFTWTAVMQLYERGEIDLHTDLNVYLDFTIPEASGEAISLHHLMTHTAGFEDDARSLFAPSQESLLSLREQVMLRMPARVYPPGTIIAYSNYGTALAGYIVERVSGQSYERYIEEHILKPLGMDASFVGSYVPAQFKDSLALGYSRATPYGSAIEWPSAVPAAPLRTTAIDMAAFMIAQLDDPLGTKRLLNAESALLMHDMHFAKEGDTGGMAYGFLRMQLNGQTVLWHLGKSPCFTTLLALLPEQRLGIFLSYNGPIADEGRAALFGFLDEFYPAQRQAFDPKPLDDWRQRARGYTGNYVAARSNHTSEQKLLNYFSMINLRIKNGRLSFNGWDFAEAAPGAFRQIGGDRMLRLDIDSDGRPWIVSGVLAYFKVPWYETPALMIALIACTITLCAVSLYRGIRHRSLAATPSLPSLALINGLCLYTLSLLAVSAVKLARFSLSYVYPANSMAMASMLFRLSLPWAVAVVAVAIEAIILKRWNQHWRRLFAAQAIVACAIFIPLSAMRVL
jgi:CubicO group peptidase (beta-lactamase class C family)